MRIYFAHLRRELWAQRALFAAFVGLALVLTIGMIALGPWAKVVKAGFVVSAVTVFGWFFALVVVIPELFPRERQPGTLSWISRLPGGIHGAWLSKKTVALLSLVALPSLAFLIGSGVRFAVDPDRGFFFVLGPSFLWFLVLLELSLAATAWLLAFSTWVSRGILAVPLLGIAFGLPLWALHALEAEKRGWVRSFLDTHGWTFHLLAPLGFLALWISLVRGRRFGGGRTRSALLGGPLLLCTLGLGGGLAWERHHEWNTFDPSKIRSLTAIDIDETGSHVRVTASMGWDRPSEELTISLGGGALPATFRGLHSSSVLPPVFITSGRAGQTSSGTFWKTEHHFADGTIATLQDRRLNIDGPRGRHSFDVRTTHGPRVLLVRGQGFVLYGPSETDEGYSYWVVPLHPGHHAFELPSRTHGSWVSDHHTYFLRGWNSSAVWSCRNHLTGETTTSTLLKPTDSVHEALADGRWLVTSMELTNGRRTLDLVDPETQERTPIQFPESLSLGADSWLARRAKVSLAQGITSQFFERELLILNYRACWLDPRTNTLDLLPYSGEFVARLDEHRILFKPNAATLSIYDAATDSIRKVFPKTD